MLYLIYKPIKLKQKTHKHILSKIIRNGTKEYNIWKFAVKEKDEFTCQNCRKKNYLEVHHKKPFTHLFKEFLIKYKPLSYIKNKGTLINLAEIYQPFWDVNNGKTLCTNCHKIIEEYKEEMILPQQFKKEMII